MKNSEISILEALNHVQSWLNAGEYDKVVQGAQEVLELEPGNQRALSLMKQAEQKRYPGSSLPYDPLTELQVEHHTEQGDRTPGTQRDADKREESDEQNERRKLFLAMLLPAIIMVLLGGSTIWWLANRQREETIVNEIKDDLPDDRSYLDENEQRLKDLTTIGKALEGYKVKTGAYPSVNKLEAALVDTGYFEVLPSDPRQGETDKAGRVFGYIYALYDGIGGENSVYIVSALFEDGKGFGYPWTKGSPIKNYPNYRNYEEKNVTFITPQQSEQTEYSTKSDAPTVKPENQK